MNLIKMKSPKGDINIVEENSTAEAERADAGWKVYKERATKPAVVKPKPVEGIE